MNILNLQHNASKEKGDDLSRVTISSHADAGYGKNLREIWKNRTNPQSLEDDDRSSHVFNVNASCKRFSVCLQRPTTSPNPGCSFKEATDTNDILREMISYKNSLIEKKSQMATFEMSVSALEEQIEEVENILDACNRHLETGWVGNMPNEVGFLGHELFTFQEDMIDRILNCLDVLYELLNPLNKTEAGKARKNTIIVKNFEKLKKGKDQSVAKPSIIVEKKGTVDDDETSEDPSDIAIYKVMKAVIMGLDLFESTCTDLWGIALGHFFDGLEHSLMTRRQVLSSGNISTKNNTVQFQADQDCLKVKVKKISSDLMDCFSRQLSLLMVVLKIKNLQIVSLDHHIGMVFLHAHDNSSKPTARGFQGRSKSSGLIAGRKRKLSASSSSDRGFSNGKLQCLEENQCSYLCKRKPTNISRKKPKIGSMKNCSDTNDKFQKNPSLISGTNQYLSFPAVKLRKVAGSDTGFRRSPHMRAAADMPLPLLELSSCNKLLSTQNRMSCYRYNQNISQLDASGISPWINKPKKTTDALRWVPKRLSASYSSASKFSKSSTKTSESCSSTTSSLTKQNTKSKATSLPKIRAKAQPSKKRTVPSTRYLKEIAEFHDDNGRVVDCMGHPVDTSVKKTIYYSRFTPMPTPPYSRPTKCLPKQDVKMGDDIEDGSEGQSNILRKTRKKRE